MIIKDRDGKVLKIDSASKFQCFLYRHFLGRLLLKFLTLRFISKLGGCFMNSFLSKKLIKTTIKKNNIDLSLYENKKYSCYNDFFTRKLKTENLNIDREKTHFISPCDSKLTIYNIDNQSYFEIKNSLYKISDLLNDEQLAKQYESGYILIFRLEVTDYHRYIYIDDGTKNENRYIKGILHTVNPIALERYPIYKQNSRVVTTLYTNNFGNVTQIEVGALMVGKIKNHHENYAFSRGEQKGLFLFGGSTVVLLVEKNRVIFDTDILENTDNFTETVVKAGEKIGVINL